ncbi:hypothetical protein [Microcoleus vaginatus]|uniref:hypothetical protein n=1 Tax=Microcoleus vaginatus TaxID=119532 RepID=UPI001688EE9D|nr:hypothetical protein [Microcoleus sp. FACHB-84]MBD2011479.1 hypothetical protein [Microcoleus sp. FACHB-45]
MCCQHSVASSTDRTHKIDLVNQESTEKFYLDRTVRAEAKKSQPSIAWGIRQAKNNQGFKGWRDLEARSYLHLKEFLTQKVNTFVLRGKI